MLFYEDLVRKIEEEKIENIEKIEKFKLIIYLVNKK